MPELSWIARVITGTYQPVPDLERYRIEYGPLSISLEEHWPVRTLYFRSTTASWPEVWETLNCAIPDRKIAKGSDDGERQL
jgi:hypothetical protein